MGLTYNHIKFIQNSISANHDIKRIVTIGHLTLYANQSERKKLGIQNNQKTFVDDILIKLFKVDIIESIDYSDYQECSIKHDLNYPIDPSLKNNFDILIDGGTIEHVFNVPELLKNYMKLVKTGGHIFIFTMANNHLGHGFYQFSPELFYSVFTNDNGFKINNVILEEHDYPGLAFSKNKKYYAVNAPQKINSRVNLVNHKPTTILVHSTKTYNTEPFQNTPIQSDYLTKYDNRSKRSVKNKKSKTRKITDIILKLILGNKHRFVVGRNQLWRFSFKNKAYYTKIRI